MKFKRIYIEITNQCNLTCDFCADSHRPIRILSVDEFRKICEQIRFYTDFIYLHVQGEPLLHPHLKDILMICEEFKLKVQLVTNGTLIDEKFDLLENSSAIRQISVSLQSMSTIGYLEDSIKRQKLVNQLVLLSKMGKIIQIRLWNYNNQVFTKGINDCLLYFDIRQEELLIEKKRYFTNHDNIYFSLDKQFQWPSQPGQLSTVGHCYGTKSMVAILSDGTLVPCCLDHQGAIDFGNVLVTPFSTLLQSPRFQKMQTGFNNKTIIEPFCQSCQYRSRFD
jgi:radical SAM protein with 4Fe4S-binding SPASM domain